MNFLCIMEYILGSSYACNAFLVSSSHQGDTNISYLAYMTTSESSSSFQLKFPHP